MTPEGTLFGVDLPCFGGAFGHDLAPNERFPTWSSGTNAMAVYEPLVFARDAGFAAVRVALCEGGEGIVTRGGAIDAVHPALLESIRVIQECARLVGLRVYFSLLDGATPGRDDDGLTRSAVGEQRAAFAERVAAPVARVLDPRAAMGLEVLAESDTLATALGWDAVRAFVGSAAATVRELRPEIALTSGCAAEALPALFAASNGLTAVDVRVRAGAILPAISQPVQDLPWIVGALDAASLAPEALVGGIESAVRAGYRAVFVSRLDGVLCEGRRRTRSLTASGRAVNAFLRAR